MKSQPRTPDVKWLCHIGSGSFDDPGAHAILRSSDGVDFRVVKRIISHVDPVSNGQLPCPPLFFRKSAVHLESCSGLSIQGSNRCDE